MQKYKCDFCKRRSTKSAMERHEKICFRNPNRYCDYCKNKGEYTECYGDVLYDGDCGIYQTFPCPYCSKRDTKVEKAIAEYEKSTQTPPPTLEESVPF